MRIDTTEFSYIRKQYERKNMSKEFFWPETFCVVGDDIWFVYGKVCSLCKYSIKDNICEVIGALPVDNLTRECLFDTMIYNNDILFIIPCWADNIIIYNIKTKKTIVKELPGERNVKFNGAYLVNNNIICIPSVYPYIVSVDIRSYEVTFKCSIKKAMENEKIDYFNDSVMIDENTVIMVSPQCSCLFYYKIRDNVFEIKDIGIQAQGYNFIIKIYNKIVLCDDKGKKIYVYNLETEKVEKQYWPEGKELVALIAAGDNRVIIDDYNSSWMGMFDENLSLKMLSSVEVIHSRKLYGTYLVGKSTLYDENIIYFNNCDMSFNWVKEDKIERRLKIVIEDENREKISSYLKKMNIVRESYICTLKDFIK